jgi:hypothetical protein
LVGAASQGKLLIVDQDGSIKQSIQLRGNPGHSCLRNARQIDGGRFIVAEESSRAVRIYAADGTLAREIKLGFCPYSAVQLTNGNILACGQSSVVEIDAQDHVVWKLEGSELPDIGVRWFAGAQVLPNKNVLICNAGGKVPFIEINHQKQVVWQWPSSTPAVALGHGIQQLNVEGTPLK